MSARFLVGIGAAIVLGAPAALFAADHITSAQWSAKARTQFTSTSGGHTAQSGGEKSRVPEGFSKTYTWDRADQRKELVAIVNAGDELGVRVTGLKRGDKVEVVSAAGQAAFDEGTVKKVSSIIGDILKLGGAGEGTQKALDTATTIADRLIGAQTNGKKVRDAFGYGKEQYETDEGGILVSMPSDNGPYYASGGHLKEHKARTDDQRPAHIKDGFFLVRDDPANNTRVAKSDGDVFLIAWDSKFSDNEGYYVVVLRLTRGG